MAKKELVSTDDIKLDAPVIDLDKEAAEQISELPISIEKDVAKIAKAEKFSFDQLEVIFGEPANENESPLAEVTVQGKYFCGRRDGDTVYNVPRYMMEVLARSKTMRVSTIRKMLPDGSETMEPKVSYSPCYPFTVVSDPAGGRGTAWLRNIMQQPA